MPIPFLSSINLTKNEVENFKIYNLANDPTLTSAGDYGYFWLNTTNTGGVIPTLKWWDGTNIRSLIDSTNIGSFTSGLATDLAGGGAGQIVYQDGANDTKFLAAGNTGQVLSSNGASAPSWLNQSSLAAGTAANISGGLAGQLLYQSALATTAKLTIGTAGQALVVNAGATAPEWVDQSTFSVGSATNKPGGNVGDILVQSGSGTTGFLNVGTTGQVITSNGASPQYVNQSTLSVGSATTSGTATNIAGGAANRIPYQTAAGTTAFITDAANSILTTNASSVPALTAATSVTVGKAVDIALGAAGDLLYQSASNDTSFLNIGTNGQVLTSSGSAPQWSNQSSLSVGSATTAGSVTNALTAGSYLTSTGTFNGSAARTFAVDATDANTASKVVARDANGNFSAGTITATTVTGLSAPSAGSDAANRNYVDSVAQGLDVKASCLVATTGDITLSSPGAISIDNIPSTSFTSGTTRILVRAQSTASQNGIYIWNGPSSAMTRSADADTWDELVSAFTFIEKGDTLRDTGWVCTIDAGGTLGTTAITWSQFSGAGSYTAGRGMVLDGTAFNFAQSTNYTADTIPYASGATTIGFIGAGNANQVLRVPGAGGTPAFGAIDLTKSAAVTGALPAANGGTGQSTYAVGDILFADGATSLAKLADVATGNALISGGVATAPSWGKIGLTTHVSGTLPIANGGTGATSFTQGRVLFAGASAISSSANLFWDAANNFLGINTSTPIANLDVRASNGVGAVFLRTTDPSAAVASAYIQTPVSTGHSATSVYGFWYQNTGVANPSAETLAINTNATERLRIASDGVCTWSNAGGVAGTAMTLNATGLGVGVSPATKLHIAGTGTQTLKIQTNTSGNPTLALEAAGVDGASMFFNRSGNYFGIGISGVATAVAIDTSGNVGIGTATPTYKLDVLGAIASNNGTIKTGISYGSTGVIGTFSNHNLSIITNDATVAAFTTSGNLGLGVTPKTWGSAYKAIQVNTTGAVTSYSGAVILGNNYYANSSGNPAYITAAAAGAYAIVGKAHTWYRSTDATPVADGACTLDPAMTLDASGNLALGTATANFRADIQNASGSAILRLKGGTGAAQGSAVYLTYAGSANTLLGIGDRATILGGTPDQLACIYSGVALTFEVNGLERLRIKSTGQVNFVGLASDPAGAAGDVVYNSTSNRLKYHNGTAWVDSGTRKYVVQLSDGSVTVAGNAYTLTHNFGTQDVTVSIRRTTDNAVVQADVVMPAGGNTVTVTFAAAITAAEFYVTVIG